MTLEFEKLSQEIERMGQTTSSRQAKREAQIAALLAKLQQYAVDWEEIERCVNKAKMMADEKWFRAALPLAAHEPLDRGVPAPAPPAQATLIATDGSQILPDRHAPFLYYLINVGGMVYYHGNGRSPHTFTLPQLTYPSDDLDESTAQFNSASVSIKRDLAEIGILAQTTWQNRYETAPVIALMDQRLLYWPIGSIDHAETVHATQSWLAAMQKIRDSQAILAGYIDSPDKIAVLNMLYSLDVDIADFDVASLTRNNQSLNDAELFSKVLRPGERSPVFVDISHRNNEIFAQQNQEIAFFYLNPGRRGGKVARVDIPVWAAQQPEVVTQLHALLYHQCQIMLGDYPYILTRADEEAVVGRKDQEYLDSWIALAMQKYGVANSQTSKQEGKDIARAGKTRHGL
jgi:hypothetical protein